MQGCARSKSVHATRTAGRHRGPRGRARGKGKMNRREVPPGDCTCSEFRETLRGRQGSSLLIRAPSRSVGGPPPCAQERAGPRVRSTRAGGRHRLRAPGAAGGRGLRPVPGALPQDRRPLPARRPPLRAAGLREDAAGARCRARGRDQHHRLLRLGLRGGPRRAAFCCVTGKPPQTKSCRGLSLGPARLVPL